MTSSVPNLSLAVPRRLRGALAMFVLTIYLFGGLFHCLSELDVAFARVGAVVSLADDKSSPGHSENGGLADHHCHGCFSVSVPVQVIGATDMTATVKVVAAREVARRGQLRGIDPPPPKSLT